MLIAVFYELVVGFADVCIGMVGPYLCIGW
jgi:hypothetical protein